jgi:SAM-dependent methyltransferase
MCTMNLIDLVHRTTFPLPWAEGDNIPWHEPGFSARMLREHLSQAHDAASRRCEIIARQVDWIHSQVLSRTPTTILDLGCGPGFYCAALARLGHTCRGIDYSPASIEYAVSKAVSEGLSCTYTCQDMRQADFPPANQLVMLIYGEFNIFRPADSALLLDKAWRALPPGGTLLLEPHTYAMVRRLGEEPASWHSSPGGLFCADPHFVLREKYWDEGSHTATVRYYVVDAASGKVTPYAQSFQAYTDDDYRNLLVAHGFGDIQFRPALSEQDPQEGLFVILAHKQA